MRHTTIICEWPVWRYLAPSAPHNAKNLRRSPSPDRHVFFRVGAFLPTEARGVCPCLISSIAVVFLAVVQL